jgi:hypothetical protein
LNARGKTNQKTLGEGLGEVQRDGFGFHLFLCFASGFSLGWYS